MTSSLQKGIEAAKLGSMDEALAHLKDAIIEEPDNADVWIWLSAIIEDEDKQVIFLKKALDLDPNNRQAQRGLAFIERKQYSPPKVGETLSDYTKPIGLFRSSPNDQPQPPTPTANQPAQAAAQTPASPATATQSPAQAEATPSPETKPEKPPINEKTRAWLDVVLYGIILMVFVIIGILVGSTMINIDLPYFREPTPVLQVPPSSEGVFLMSDGQYEEMSLFLGEPDIETGIPTTSNPQQQIAINTPLIVMDKLLLKYENGDYLAFQTQQTENAVHILTPQFPLQSGLYCLVYELNPEKNEALYWCFRVE